MERHYTNGTEPDILPHYSRCAGPCDQGRKVCPCPSRCQGMPDNEFRQATWRLLAKALLAVALVATIVVLLSAGVPA